MITLTEAMKNLLTDNLNELKYQLKSRFNLDLDLSIEFKDNNDFVVLKNGKVILKRNIENYDIDFYNQKVFILDVMEEIAAWVEDLEVLEKTEQFYNLIKVDNKEYFDILGQGDIFYNDDYCVEIDTNKFDYDGDFDEYEDYIEYFKEEIRNFLDGNKIRVVMYENINDDIIKFYVGGVINNFIMCIKYINDIIDDVDNFKDLDDCDDIDEIADYAYLEIYFSLTPWKEVEKAVEFIKKLVD